MKTKLVVTFLDENMELDCVTIEADLSRKVGRRMTHELVDAVIDQLPRNQRLLNIMVANEA